MLPRDFVLLGRELSAPLGVGFDDFFHITQFVNLALWLPCADANDLSNLAATQTLGNAIPASASSRHAPQRARPPNFALPELGWRASAAATTGARSSTDLERTTTH
jgi:hypothetical protein